MQALLITLFIFTCTLTVNTKIVYPITKEDNNKQMQICKIDKAKFDEEALFTNENWEIEIPKIGLKANINYGTSQEIMSKFVGHFDETKFWNGNVGLAAHNRGYPVNYFGGLKELQVGDEIKYTTVFGTKTYKVAITTIIEDTDWTYLAETKDNRITLITCVEDEPSYRRCIQGIEI